MADKAELYVEFNRCFAFKYFLVAVWPNINWKPTIVYLIFHVNVYVDLKTPEVLS